MKNSAYKRALTSGAALIAIGIAGPAFAQDSNAQTNTQAGTTPPPSTNAEGEIVITGSLIRDPNLTATSPLTVVGAADFQKQDSSDVQDTLLRTPEVYAGNNAKTGFTSNAGVSTLSLRNIGANRTLILIDGKRLAPTDSAGYGAADISIIPSILIKRVDIITGGASAIYGSDALGGVVNFVMDRLNGIRADVTVGAYQHDNNDDFIRNAEVAAGFTPADKNFFGGQHVDAAVAAGVTSKDDRAHLQVYFDYSHQRPINNKQLDFAGCNLYDAGPSAICVGSSTPGSAQFLAVNGTANSYFLDPVTGALRQYQASDTYTGQFGYLENESTRYLAGFMGDVQVTQGVKAYATFSYLKLTAATIVSPTELIGTPRTIECDNPMLTGDEINVFCGGSTAGTFTSNITRRNVEGDPRTLYNESDQFRATAGIDADAGPFHFNLHAQYTRAEANITYANDFSEAHVSAALNDCLDSGGAPISGCVPYNIFQPGAVSQAAVKYLQAAGNFRTLITEKLVSATVNADLGKYGIRSPFATEGVSFALGTEYREENYSGNPDFEAGSGDLETFGGFPAITGGYKIKEFFGEVRLPLVQDKPLIHELSVGGAFRDSDYNTFGTTWTYALNADYSPTTDVRFRGSYNRAIRAPSLSELYSSQGIGYGPYTTDNCEGTAPVYTAAQCANTGVTAAQYGHVIAAPAGLYHNVLFGGNPNLDPEKANTYSAGFVFTPRFLRGLSLSADWYDIEIKGVISAPSPQTLLDQCALTGSSFYCGFIHRDPATGSLWLNNNGYVFNALINAGVQKTSGVDVNATYAIPSRLGGFNLSLAGSYVYRQDIEVVPGATPTKCAGRFGYTCGQPTPNWRHAFTVDWTTPWAIDITAAWRFVSAVRNEDPTLSVFANRIGAQSYFDLSAAYRFMKHYTVRLGVNNIFDKDPPLITVTSTGAGTNGNTFPSTYDSFGRTLYAKLSVNF